MEKDRGTKVLALIAIFIAVVGMTIGFAAFSTSLEINGAAQVQKSNWSVRFANLQAASLVGTAAEVTAPTIKRDATLIEAYDVTLMTPGDEVSYTFDIENDGTYDAVVTGLTIAGKGSKVLTATGGDSDDQQNVLDKLSYKLTYVGGAKDGEELAIGDELAKKVGDTATKATVKLTLKYAAFTDQSLLPKDNITIGGLDVAVIYGQKTA